VDATRLSDNTELNVQRRKNSKCFYLGSYHFHFNENLDFDDDDDDDDDDNNNNNLMLQCS